MTPTTPATLERYRVWIKSTPGCYEQYSGKIDVWADNEDDAIERAFNDLFRNWADRRSRTMWKVEKVERLH